jgi:hypothetical protein
LYRGDLLQGCYQEWCLFERERLQNMYLAMLEKLMEYCLAHHDYEVGLTYGENILRYDRTREGTHALMMQLRYLHGDRSGALRQYENCTVALNEELGVRPAKRTVYLYERICVDELQPDVGRPSEGPGYQPSSPPADAIPQLLTHLNQFRTMLLNLQEHIQHELQLVEYTLHDTPEQHTTVSESRYRSAGPPRNQNS